MVQQCFCTKQYAIAAFLVVAASLSYYPRDAHGFVLSTASNRDGIARTSPTEKVPRLATLYVSTMDNQVQSQSTGNSKKKDHGINGNVSMTERITNSGMASAAAFATAAVNAAVSMKTLEAPDVDKSYISLDKTQTELDEEGLPLVYDKDLIQAYWSKEKGALNRRWGVFVGKAVPFLTKLTTLFIRDGAIAEKEIPGLSRQARLDLQELGPTFIKVRSEMYCG